MLGLGIFVMGMLVCMIVDDMIIMLIGCLIQVFGVLGLCIVLMVVICDQFVGEVMVRVMLFIMMVFILVLMIVLMVGQWVISVVLWMYIFMLFLVVFSGVGLWYFICQFEILLVEDCVFFFWVQFFCLLKFIFIYCDVIGLIVVMGCVFGVFLFYISVL